jgi:hypothetical protein
MTLKKQPRTKVELYPAVRYVRNENGNCTSADTVQQLAAMVDGLRTELADVKTGLAVAEAELRGRHAADVFIQAIIEGHLRPNGRALVAAEQHDA